MDFVMTDRHVVVDVPEYRCVLDEYRRGDDQMMIVHLTVRKFSASTFSKLLREWALLRASTRAPLYAYGEVDDDKYERFITLLGFQHIAFIPCTDGQERRVFVSFPKDFSYAREDQQDGNHEARVFAVGSANSVPD